MRQGEAATVAQCGIVAADRSQSIFRGTIMGFHRQSQAAALDRAGIAATVSAFVAEEVAFANRTSDPFWVDDPCPFNPTGHQFIGSCGDVACCHCAKVVWS